MSNLVVDMKANSMGFYPYINSQKNHTQGPPLCKRGMELVLLNEISRSK